jgi:tRNA uridine 5-carboxymethylaminomethyl modification enzyme
LGQFPRQDGDVEPYWFSFHQRSERLPQLPCYLAWAGVEVRRLVEEYLHESALYGGAISGRGPRYCPSIEDKIVKFRDAERHQLFLEPEGLETRELYVNGLSTSLPPSVQLAILHSVPGLESARMTRPGYAIEYDYLPPTQLLPSLEVRGVTGLYFAGQINGTTGYEEAAGQGIIAGINAGLATQGKDPLVLRRDQALLGVLVDDLVTRGVDEPYRLFTSRAEYRLLLRQDNALRRLLPVSSRLGLLSESELAQAERRLGREEQVRYMAEATVLDPHEANPVLEGAGSQPIREPTRVAELVRRPGVMLRALIWSSEVEQDQSLVEWADIELKYEGYLLRERADARRLAVMEDFVLPDGLPYSVFGSLSHEAREKLARLRPETLGRAGRVPGISPSDLQNLVLEVLKWRRNQDACARSCST